MLNENPVFVVGVFRSGTSLLCSLLNQNPRMAVMYECDVWNFPRPLLARRFRNNWAARMEFYNQALSRHRLVAPDNLRGLEKIRTPVDLYQAFGRPKGAAVCGEKSPVYCSRLEQLHQTYPQASFILVWRNPVEVYRSVLKAGQTSRFFGRPGMLSRIIYQQEQLVRQGERIEKNGARVFRVSYADLVAQTGRVCRDLCDFLGVPYDPQMLELKNADLSTIYRNSPNHDHLRRGIIERRKYTEQLVSPAINRKLERFRHRWEQQQAGWLNPPDTLSAPSKPGQFELACHFALGRALTVFDSLVRAGFEFMPLTWLRIYRLLKRWVVNPPSGTMDEKTSMLKDLKAHWITLLTATGLLGGVVFIHLHANPHLFFILFYAVPCLFTALVVNTRWATMFVLACSLISPLVQYDGDPDYRSLFVFLWNCFSRLILLEMIVLMIGRIKMDFSKTGHHAD